LFLGIDTSCYTTSIAVVNEQEELILEKRQLLNVSEGSKGLPQSEALFHHLKRLPDLLDEAGQSFCYSRIKAVCSSTVPRPDKASYMPVFVVSERFGKTISLLFKIPYFTVSHQENHLRSGLWSANLRKKCFLAIHLSGGTTELLKVYWDGGRFSIKVLGGTLDINAGQFIDRVGVKLGLPFPAGPYLEDMAKYGQELLHIPSWVKDYTVSFSGPETAAIRYINQNKKPHDIARSVENTVAKTIEKLLRKAIKDENINEVLLVGGVIANNYVREKLKSRLEHQAVGGRLYFAAPQHSGDNAIGNALIARDRYLNQHHT